MKTLSPHFLLTPNSFKDSLSAPVICKAMATGIQRVIPDARITIVPLSDGGEGFAETVILATNGERYPAEEIGPLGEPVQTIFV